MRSLFVTHPNTSAGLKRLSSRLRCAKSRLLVVVGHTSLMGGLRSFPTRDLFKMHLTHAPHHVKMGLNQVLPALPWMNILLLDLSRFTHGKELLGAKHRAIVGDERLWCAETFDSGVQDNQDTDQILSLEDGTGEDRAREGIHHRDDRKRAFDVGNPMFFQIANIQTPPLVPSCRMKRGRFGLVRLLREKAQAI